MCPESLPRSTMPLAWLAVMVYVLQMVLELGERLKISLLRTEIAHVVVEGFLNVVGVRFESCK